MSYEYKKYKLLLVQEEAVSLDYDLKVTNPEDIHKFCTEVCKLHQADREHMIEICINAKGEIIGWHTVSVGDLCCTVIHPREVFKYAIEANAASIVLCHNHPSGNSQPSEQDLQTTERLIESADILGFNFLDHIVIGHDNEYTSMKTKGLI